MEISIFKNSSDWLEDEIYIHGLNNIIKQIFKENGGPIKFSKNINKKYSITKEWISGRKPLSIKDLKKILSICNNKSKKIFEKQINKQEKWISCRYSWRKVRFPNKLKPELAYIVGIILGDGSLAGNSSNKTGNWNISGFFDNKEHQKYFDQLINKELGFYPKNFSPIENYEISYFCSKAAHYFLRTFFDIPNSFKSGIIKTPKIIKDAPMNIQKAFIQGLFDSDGTFTCNEIRYSTTSKTMIDQVKSFLDNQEIKSYIGKWQKKGGYQLLYTIYIKSKKGKQEYYNKIGFEHPNKKFLLENSINSLVA